MAKAELHLRSCPEKRKKKKKKEKRHSVFLFSLLLVFILSYWPTTLASLRSRPEPYSTSNKQQHSVDLHLRLFQESSCYYSQRRGVFLFRLVCPFRSPLSFTHVRPKNQQAISLWKHFLQNSILGKNFLKKKWSGLCWLDDWPNCITSIRCATRKPVSSSERDADSFQDLENISLTPKGSRLLKKWTNPILFYYFVLCGG